MPHYDPTDPMGIEPVLKFLEEYEKLGKIRELMHDWRYASDWNGEGSGPMPDRVALLKLEAILDGTEQYS